MVKITDNEKLKNFGRWLARKREESGFDSKRQLALATGLSPATISRIEAGTQKAEPETLKKIAPHFKMSYENILAEAGYLPPAEPDGTDTNSLVERFNQLTRDPGSVENISVLLAELVNILPSLAKATAQTESNTRRIPILGTIRAGIPILAGDNREGEIEVPPHMKADFALRVEGDSMIYAGIHPGDLALCKETSYAGHGDIVAAGVEEEEWRANLKFYIKKGGQIFLRSANPEYEDIEFGPNHRIIGVIVGTLRESPPSLSGYQELLQLKEYQDNRWTEVIETAVSSGFKPEHLKQLIDMQLAVATNLVNEAKKPYKA